MKNIIIIAILSITIGILTACNHAPETVQSVTPKDTVLTDFQKRQKQEEQNRAVSKSQEIPTGKETFDKLVDFIWKKGFTINGGYERIPCGRQYTFYDSRGNRHGYLAIKTESDTGQASMTGKVYSIVTYGFYKGIRDQEHFFPYDITEKSVFCSILSLDGTWKDVEAATFGYKEFLKKCSDFYDKNHPEIKHRDDALN